MARNGIVVCLLATLLAVWGCGGSGNQGATEAPPTQAEIDAAFEHEWNEWKLSKYESLSREERDTLTLRGAGSPKDIVLQSLERQAEPWKDDLRDEFKAKFTQYQALLERLDSEGYADPQRERTEWFGDLIVEVSGE